MMRSKVNTIITHLTRHVVAVVCVSVLASLSLRAEVPGTGKLSGTVTASQAFTAAQVYIRNVDLGIVYMVYTNQGRYRAVALFPGNYEVSVSTKHLESDAQTVTITAGETAEVNLSLSPLSGDVPQLVIPAGRTAMESGASGVFEYANYDEIYPPGPGREVAEQVCMVCHGELVRLKPATAHLTSFYLLVAAGGALGGVMKVGAPASCQLSGPAASPS